MRKGSLIALLVVLMLNLAIEPACAWSTTWEYDNPKKAKAIWLVTMPVRITVRVVKLAAREVVAGYYIVHDGDVPQVADYMAEIKLGD